MNAVAGALCCVAFLRVAPTCTVGVKMFDTRFGCHGEPSTQCCDWGSTSTSYVTSVGLAVRAERCYAATLAKCLG